MNQTPENGSPKREPPFTRRQVKYLILIITLSILIYTVITHYAVALRALLWIVGLFEPFIIGLCIAFVLNTLLTPLEKLWSHLFLRKKQGRLALRLKRPICLCLTVLILFGAVFAVLFMLIPEIKQSVSGFIASISQNVNNILGVWNGVRDFAANLNISLPNISATDWTAAVDFVADFVKNLWEENAFLIIGSTMSFTASVFSTAFNAVLALAFSIYILAQKEKLGRQTKKLVRALFPQKTAENLLELSDLTHRSFARFVSGQMTEAVIIGLLCFVGMLIFGFPYAGVISVLVGFTALVPIFGAFIGTAIGAFLILLINPLQAVWFVIFIIVLQQLEGNLIYPKVVGKSVGLPGIWVLLAVTVGGNAWSLPGMLLAVPLSSVIYTLLRRFVNRRLRSLKETAQEPKE